MNIFSTTQLLKSAMLMGFLIMPAISWADDHLLSINGATVTQPAIVTHAGTLTQPLILSNFDGNPTLTFGQSQTLTVVSASVKMCKPGTNKQLEWLDQGNTVVGVTGTLTNAIPIPTNGYRLVLTMTGISNTYGSANGPCTVLGAKTYTYTANAAIDKRNGNSDNYTNKLTTTYNFWNATNSIPEPGTIFLLLIGLLGLGWMSMTRKHQMHGASA